MSKTAKYEHIYHVKADHMAYQVPPICLQGKTYICTLYNTISVTSEPTNLSHKERAAM